MLVGELLLFVVGRSCRGAGARLRGFQYKDSMCPNGSECVVYCLIEGFYTAER